MVRASGPPAPVTFASFGEDREPRGGKKKKAEGGSPRKGLRAGGVPPGRLVEARAVVWARVRLLPVWVALAFKLRTPKVLQRARMFEF